MRKTLLISSVIASTMLAGCITPLPPGRSFDAANRSVSSRDAVVIVGQSEVNVQVNPSNAAAATGGGLIGALIQAGIDQYHASSAEDSVKPVRAALVDYDFDKSAMSKTQDACSKIDWLAVSNTSYTKDETDDNYTKILDASKADQVMFNLINYKFSYDFTSLEVNMLSAAYSKASAVGETAHDRMSLKNALYYHRFKYQSYLPTPGSDKDANAAKWADNQGALARTALETGLAQVTQELANDLRVGAAAPAPVAAN